jgi:hypothetical protein
MMSQGRRGIPAASHAVIGMALALAACATQRAAAPQTIDVRFDPPLPHGVAPLSCKASNQLGSWPFLAPGSVTVTPTLGPLKIECQVPDGVPLKAVVRGRPAGSSKEAENVGTAAGAAVGAGAAAAAAPVMSGALGAAVVIGAAVRGREIAGLISFIASGGAVEYPKSVVLQLPQAPARAP